MFFYCKISVVCVAIWNVRTFDNLHPIFKINPMLVVTQKASMGPFLQVILVLLTVGIASARPTPEPLILDRLLGDIKDAVDNIKNALFPSTISGSTTFPLSRSEKNPH